MTAVILNFPTADNAIAVGQWTSGDQWAADNRYGRTWASDIIDHLDACEAPIILGAAIKSMLDRGAYGGVEVGFCQEIGERLIRSTATSAVVLQFPPAAEPDVWGEERNRGRVAADQLIQDMRNGKAPIMLGFAVQGMIEAKRFGGYEAGFFELIGERLLGRDR